MNNIEKIILTGILYLIFFSCAAVWGLSYDNWQLREQLKWVSPLFLEMNFFLIFIGIIVNWDSFRMVIQKIDTRTGFIMLVIVLVGTLTAMFLAPRTHKIYYDEDIYLNIGQNIANLKTAGMCNEGEHIYGKYFCHRLEYNKQPNGWPYLISVILRIFGTSHLACHLMNNFIWGLSALAVFFIGYLLFEDKNAGIFGALIFILMPEGLIWSNTTSAEPSSALWVSLALLAVIFFAKTPENRSLFLVAVLLPFAFQFRPESILIVLPVGLVLILMIPKEFLKQRTYLFILLFLMLTLPHFIHLYAVRGEGWGAVGESKFALKYFEENFRVNSLFYFKNKRFPLFFTLLFFTGVFMPKLNPGKKGETVRTATFSFFWKEKTVVFSWFLAFWGIFLFFYAGSYNYGADVRFSLLSYIPLGVLAGFGAAALSRWATERLNWEWSSCGMTILILICFLSFMPYIRAIGQEAWGARADHEYAEIMAEKLPSDSLILAHNPNMFLLWGKNAAQASIASQDTPHLRNLFKRFPGGIYFHYNFWCNVSNPAQRSFCDNILEKFETTEILSFQEREYKYSLHKLSLSKD